MANNTRREWELLLAKAKQARARMTLLEFLNYQLNARQGREGAGVTRDSVAAEIDIDSKTLFGTGKGRWPAIGVKPTKRRDAAIALVFDGEPEHKIPTDLLDEAQELLALEAPAGADDEVEAYLRRTCQHFNAHAWADAPMELQVVHEGDGNKKLPAEKALSEWLSDPDAPRLCFLTGDPGSGKTFQLDRLARDVSREALELGGALVPISLSLGKTGTRPPPDLLFLRLLCENNVPEGLLQSLGSERQALLLLDGLDQSRNIELKTSPEAYLDLIDRLDAMFQRRARIVISCRTVDLERLRGLIGPRIRSLKLHLFPVSEPAADAHFERTSVRAAWRRFREVPEVQRWTQTPFNIRLLELVLPGLGEVASLDLFSFYDRATREWLHRAIQRASHHPGEHEFVENDVAELVRGLKNIASPHLRRPIGERGFQICLESGIIRMTQRGALDFHHPSLWEFFLAMAVRDELAEYRAESLARLNLITYYNVNRFLVPALRQLPPLARASCPNQSSGPLTRPIKVGEYAAFCDRTHWREHSGYGIHPTLAPKDGNPLESSRVDCLSAEPAVKGYGARIPTDQSSPVDHLSWYDAFVFSRRVGGTIASSKEVREAQPPLGSEPRFFWCLDWFDERKAHVEVLSWDGSRFDVHGRNPDYRSAKLGFCVTWKEQQS